MFKSGMYMAILACLLKVAMSIPNDRKDQIQSSFVTAGEKCATIHQITEDDIAALKQRQFPEGKNAACFSACVLTEIGILDDKGEITATAALERAKEIFDEEEELDAVKEFFDTCAEDAAKGEDSCERAKLLFQCFVKNSDKFNL